MFLSTQQPVKKTQLNVPSYMPGVFVLLRSSCLFSKTVCCHFLSFSSSLCAARVLYPPLLLLALFSTAVPSAECLRCALWQCSLCISDSWVRAFHIFLPFGILLESEWEASRTKQTWWFQSFILCPFAHLQQTAAVWYTVYLMLSQLLPLIPRLLDRRC